VPSSSLFPPVPPSALRSQAHQVAWLRQQDLVPRGWRKPGNLFGKSVPLASPHMHQGKPPHLGLAGQGKRRLEAAVAGNLALEGKGLLDREINTGCKRHGFGRWRPVTAVKQGGARLDPHRQGLLGMGGRRGLEEHPVQVTVRPRPHGNELHLVSKPFAKAWVGEVESGPGLLLDTLRAGYEELPGAPPLPETQEQQGQPKEVVAVEVGDPDRGKEVGMGKVSKKTMRGGETAVKKDIMILWPFRPKQKRGVGELRVTGVTDAKEQDLHGHTLYVKVKTNMTDIIVPCKACATKNKIPAAKQHLRPRCGRCRERLNLTGHGRPVELTDQDFATFLNQARIPVLVDFYSPTCGPCRMMAPLLDRLAGRHGGKLVVAKLDTSRNPLTAARFQIRAVPTLMLFREGRVIDQVTGALPELELEQLVKRVLS